MKYTAMIASRLLAFAFVLMFESGPALADHKAAESLSTADLMQPAELAAILKSAAAPKPLILKIGFRTLYLQAHIPDSESAQRVTTLAFMSCLPALRS
jgi:hypothetical protein